MPRRGVAFERLDGMSNFVHRSARVGSPATEVIRKSFWKHGDAGRPEHVSECHLILAALCSMNVGLRGIGKGQNVMDLKS
jgi:hypothetical protein